MSESNVGAVQAQSDAVIRDMKRTLLLGFVVPGPLLVEGNPAPISPWFVRWRDSAPVIVPRDVTFYTVAI